MLNHSSFFLLFLWLMINQIEQKTFMLIEKMNLLYKSDDGKEIIEILLFFFHSIMTHAEEE